MKKQASKNPSKLLSLPPQNSLMHQTHTQLINHGFKIITIFVVSSLLFALTLASASDSICFPPISISPPPAKNGTCNVMNMCVCVDLLGMGRNSPSGSKCCALIQGMVDMEAAMCICMAIKANVLGMNVVMPVTLELLMSACQKTLPPEFQCPR